MSIRSEVVPFLGVTGGIGVGIVAVLGWIGWPWVRAAGAGFLAAGILGLYLVYFFRDPERVPPREPGLAVAGADGTIAQIARVRESRFLNEDTVRISIFLSLFDVHVNRAPIGGMARFLGYFPGRHLFTFQDKSSEVNQHNAILIEGEGIRCLVTQIVGPVARRVVYWHRDDEVWIAAGHVLPGRPGGGRGAERGSGARRGNRGGSDQGGWRRVKTRYSDWRQKVVHWRSVVPTLFTLAAMLAGFLSVLVTVEGMQSGNPDLYLWSALLIMLAMILDGLDGNLARALRGCSAFGAELDTYVDLTAFGIAPAILIFAVTLLSKNPLWRMLLPSAVALSGVVRLARFKVKDPLRGQGGYAGLPITANATWVSLFVLISLTPPRDQFSLDHGPVATLFLLGVLVFITLQVTNLRYPKPTKRAWLLAPCAWRKMMNRKAPMSRMGTTVPPIANHVPQSLGRASSIGGRADEAMPRAASRSSRSF